jgi:peroxiredoxin
MFNAIARTVCVTTLALFTAAAMAATVGQPAPDFTGTDSNGNTHSLGDFAGKTVVLEWTNHDCPYVRKHYDAGNMQRQQKAATDAGVVWLSVISSAPGKQGHVDGAAANRLTDSRQAAPSAVILDTAGDIGRAYGARTTPHMYVIDGDGVLRYMGGIDDRPTTRTSDIDGATQYVEVALAELAAGKPVSNAVTRPYGCSVKY